MAIRVNAMPQMEQFSLQERLIYKPLKEVFTVRKVMVWVRKMNNISNKAKEIVNIELIYT